MVNVLYIGENEEIIKFLSKKFKSLCFSTDKDEVLDKQADLIVVDEQFLSFIEKIRKHNNLSKIIAFLNKESDLKTLPNLEINGFLVSPFKKEQLEKTLNNILHLINLEKEKKEYIDLIVEEKTKIFIIDEITGLYNIEKFKIDNEKFLNKFLVIIDINNFKKINSAFGFDFGDKVLKEVSKKIKELPFEYIYKFPADVFVGVISKIDEHMLKEFLNLLSEIRIDFNGFDIYLTFSIVAFRVEEENSINLFTRAFSFFKDKELRNSYHIVTKKMLDDVAYKSHKISYIIKSVRESKLVPYFQAIVDNVTQKPISYEVLARIEDGDKVISPYFFIDDAKKAGIIKDITKIMVDKSFAKIENSDIRLSINITDEDLLEKGFIKFLTDKIEEYNLSTSQITIEVLENISLTEEILYKLKLLKFLDFKIAIDDFGTGYSNFEKFLEMSPDFLKIDGSFVRNLCRNKNAAKIVHSMNVFAHAMGSKVVAEFVENEEIYHKLSSIGIEYSQGYYFSKPSKELI